MHCVNSGAVMTVPAISMPIMNTQTYLALLTFNYSNLAIVSPYAFCAFSLLGDMQLRMSALFYANALIDTENAFLKLKRLVEEPGNCRFCEIEKTSFEVSKFLQRKTPVVNDGFVRNLLYSICVNNKMQLLSQNFQI